MREITISPYHSCCKDSYLSRIFLVVVFAGIFLQPPFHNDENFRAFVVDYHFSCPTHCVNLYLSTKFAFGGLSNEGGYMGKEASSKSKL